MNPSAFVQSTISSTEAVKLFNNLPEVVQAYIASRSGAYDIAPSEILMKIPTTLLDNSVEIFKFLKSKDISHITATSRGGSPNDFTNWIFEEASINRSRQADPMGLEDYLQAQIDNQVDALGIEFGTPDPGTVGFTKEFGEAFGLDAANQATEMADVGEEIAKLSGFYQVPKDGFPGEFTPVSIESEATNVLQESLSEIGIPVTYVALRGIRSVWPFLKSINWKEFKSNCRYRFSVVNRALKAFREGGWKEAVKAILMGFLIAAFPPLGYLLAALGLTGIATLGIRWLANNYHNLPAGVANAFRLIANVLQSAQKLLQRIFVFVERIVDVVVETATNVVREVVQESKRFFKSVIKTTKIVAKQCIEGAQRIGRSIGQQAHSMGKQLAGWIFSWFSPNQYSY